MYSHRKSHLAIEIDVDHLDIGLVLELSSRSSDTGAIDQHVEPVELRTEGFDRLRVANVDTLEADLLVRYLFLR